MDVIASLEQTFAHTSVVVAGVRVEQQSDKTRCAEWTVRELLEHMIAVVAGFGSAAGGSQQSRSCSATTLRPVRRGRHHGLPRRTPASLIGWSTATRSDAGLRAGRNQPARHRHARVGPGDRHGPAGRLPESVAGAALEASRSIVSPEIRAGRFGPEQPAPPDVSPTARLVVFLGRTP